MTSTSSRIPASRQPLRLRTQTLLLIQLLAKVIIGEVKVVVLEYERLEPLGFKSGHRARVVIRRVESIKDRTFKKLIKIVLRLKQYTETI